ncbi:MAG: SURF1 family protein [Gammaproteobacteria bacterium]|nr:SURF1 family protein [Gammaproteobacteria bacterium]
MNMKSRKRPAVFLIFGCYVAALSLLVSLGAWQFMRGMHKADLESRIGAVADRTVVLDTAPESWAHLDYVRVRLTGSMDTARTLLLDNRVHRGQVGYEVIVPFALRDGSATVLVNRGWIPREGVEMLDDGPAIRETEIAGQLYRPDTGIMLVDTMSATDRWPVVIQYLDIPVLSDHLGLALEPAMVVLDADAAQGFERIWQPYVMNSARHYGYAVQWWGLAVVLLVFGWIWKFGRQRKHGG